MVEYTRRPRKNSPEGKPHPSSEDVDEISIFFRGKIQVGQRRMSRLLAILFKGAKVAAKTVINSGS